MSNWDFFYWSKPLERAYGLFKESLTMRDRDGHARGMRIVGESRAGKSSFIENARKRLALEEPRLAQGLLVSQPPSKSNLDEFIETMLGHLGDPLPSARTTGIKPKDRLLRFMTHESFTGAIVDEAHLLMESKTDHFQNVAARWIRLTMNDTRRPFILVGTPVVNQFLDTNRELRERFRVKADIARYDLMDDESEADFERCLLALGEAMPIKVEPDFADAHMQVRMFNACEGLTGYLMDLVERTIHRAQTRDLPVIGLTEWADAFETEFPERAAVLNPFDTTDIGGIVQSIARRSEALAAEQRRLAASTSENRRAR